MQKRFFGIALCFATILLLLMPPEPAAAVPGKLDIIIQADKTAAASGETVHFTLSIGPTENLGYMEFWLEIPDGLTLVPGSLMMTESEEQALRRVLGRAMMAESIENGDNKFVAAGCNYHSEQTLKLTEFDCKADRGFTGNVVVGLKGNGLSYAGYNSADGYQDYELHVTASEVAVGRSGSGGNLGSDEKPGTGENAGSDEKPGNGGNPGSDEKPGNDGNPGSDEKPGNGGNPGSDEKPGNDGNPGSDKKPGNDEGAGPTEMPGNSGDIVEEDPKNNGNSAAEEKPGADGDSGMEKPAENPGNSAADTPPGNTPQNGSKDPAQESKHKNRMIWIIPVLLLAAGAAAAGIISYRKKH